MRPGDTTETPSPPPLPQRVRPPQVLLGVGAVLLVGAGAAVASAYGGGPARVLVVVLAGAAAWFSLRAGWKGLRSSAETLAGCAAGLALAASDLGSRSGGTAATVLMALVFLVLHRIAPATTVWPLAAWASAQVAVLRTLDGVPAGLHTGVFLSVALAGLAIGLVARPVVARGGLATTAPWWAAGVLTGTDAAWSGTGGRQWVAALLVVGAAAGLLVARLRAALDPLLGPPRLVPVVSGAVAAAAAAGALASLGTPAVVVAGYAGVLAATTVPGLLTGWRRGLFGPVAAVGGWTTATLMAGRLAAGAHWSALSLLLLLTAGAAVAVVWRRPETRPETLPTAVGCLTGAALLALPHGVLSPAAAAVALTAVYCAALVAGSALDRPVRRATAGAAAVCAAAAVLLLFPAGAWTALAAHLTVQGHATLVWAHRTGAGRAGEARRSPAWRLGAGQLVVAAWIGAAAAGLPAVEAYTLPAAAGLLLAAGPRLGRGPSWPAWGPGLLVATLPSTVLALAVPDEPRPVWVLAAAALAMVAGASSGVRAPLLVGAATALALAVGFAVRQVPWPLGTALVVGSLLLAVGALRERDPVAGFGRRLADLR